MMSEFALAILVVIAVMGSILFCRMYQLDDTQEWLDINENSSVSTLQVNLFL